MAVDDNTIHCRSLGYDFPTEEHIYDYNNPDENPTGHTHAIFKEGRLNNKSMLTAMHCCPHPNEHWEEDEPNPSNERTYDFFCNETANPGFSDLYNESYISRVAPDNQPDGVFSKASDVLPRVLDYQEDVYICLTAAYLKAMCGVFGTANYINGEPHFPNPNIEVTAHEDEEEE